MFKGLIIGYLPWVVFFALAGHGPDQLQAGILLSLVLLLLTGISAIMRGFLLSWVTLLFFTVQLIGVVWLQNDWMMDNILIISHTTLACMGGVSFFIGIPFTLPYAKEATTRNQWRKTAFFRINRKVSLAWMSTFIFSSCAAFFQLYRFSPDWLYTAINSLTVVLATSFTIYLPKRFYYKKSLDK